MCVCVCACLCGDVPAADTAPGFDGASPEAHTAALRRFFVDHKPENVSRVSELFGKLGACIWEGLEAKYPGATAKYTQVSALACLRACFPQGYACGVPLRVCVCVCVCVFLCVIVRVASPCVRVCVVAGSDPPITTGRGSQRHPCTHVRHSA